MHVLGGDSVMAPTAPNGVHSHQLVFFCLAVLVLPLSVASFASPTLSTAYRVPAAWQNLHGSSPIVNGRLAGLSSRPSLAAAAAVSRRNEDNSDADFRKWGRSCFGVFSRNRERKRPTVGTRLGFSAAVDSDSPNDEQQQQQQQQQNSPESADAPTTNRPTDEQQHQQRLERLRKAKHASALLNRHGSGRSPSVATTKSTSVGARRIGSATRARSAAGNTARLSQALRKTAEASVGSDTDSSVPQLADGDDDNDNDNNNNTEDDTDNSSNADGAAGTTVGKDTAANDSSQTDAMDDSNDNTNNARKPSAMSTTSVIQSTVLEMLDEACRTMSLAAIGDALLPPSSKRPHKTEIGPGATVIAPDESDTSPGSRIKIRMATHSDDYDIASLRLSVFSDCTPEMRRSFCSRSCQVLESRRRRGAQCVVATIPKHGASPASDIILGTAECSYHEFIGTKLGQRRLPGALLYITEVAVNPTVRRKGIGQKLMASFDEIARMRSVETVYLHVDVTNAGALRMYEKAGYQVASNLQLEFSEFTRSLNLHDGATKGRNHFLMFKNIRQPVWLDEYDPAERMIQQQQRQRRQRDFGILA